MPALPPPSVALPPALVHTSLLAPSPMGNSGAEEGRRTLVDELELDRGEGGRRLPWLGGRVAERTVA
jgi:hypothetical protein